MNESIYLLVDYEKICRLCLQSTGTMSQIFDNSDEIQIKDLIFSATGLQMAQDDGLPSQICHKCRFVIELTCEMQDMATRTHQWLLAASDNNDLLEQYTKKHSIESKLNEKPKTNIHITDHMKNIKNNELPKKTKNINKKLYVKIIGSDLKKKNLKNTDGSILTDRKKRQPPKHLTCQICLGSYSSNDQVEKHVQTHYKNTNLTPYFKLKRPYYCEECAESSLSKKQLVLHHRKHLNINPYVCKHPGCSYEGKNYDSLRHHVVMHRAPGLVCERCGAQFRRRWEARQHSARHHPSPSLPRLPCEACGRTFRNIMSYKMHVKLHQTAPKYVCAVRGCGRAYRSRGALATHARGHSGARDFRCHICSVAAYTTQALLNRHVRLHAMARSRRCDRCARSFAEYGAYYAHRVRRHGPWLPHRCAGCNRGYDSQVRLDKHMQSCEFAERMRAHRDHDTQRVNNVEISKTLEITHEELLNRLEGQPILVEPVRADDKENAEDGLMYIEVEGDTDCEENSAYITWQH